MVADPFGFVACLTKVGSCLSDRLAGVLGLSPGRQLGIGASLELGVERSGITVYRLVVGSTTLSCDESWIGGLSAVVLLGGRAATFLLYMRRTRR